MREYGPDELPFSGWQEPLALIRFAEVESVDEEHRGLKIKWKTFSGGQENVGIVSFPGDYSLPKVGDRVCCLVDYAERCVVIGVIQMAYKYPQDEKTRDKIAAGEVCHVNTVTGSKLLMDNDNNLIFLNVLGDGLEVDTEKEEATLMARTLRFAADVGELVYGLVKRQANPLVDAEPITSGGVELKEFAVDVVNTLGRLGRLFIGNVINDTGSTIQSWKLQDLRVLLEICGDLGVQVGSIQVDKAGNVDIQVNGIQRLSGTAIHLNAPEVVVGGEVATDHIVLGESLISYLGQLIVWANAHTHICAAPTVASATGLPPMSAPSSTTLLSKRGKIAK